MRGWRLLNAGLQPLAADKDIIYVSEQLPAQQRQPIVRMIAELCPARRPLLAATWPNDLVPKP